MEKIIYFEYIIAVAIRYWLFESDYNASLANRIEVSTPLNAWKRGNFLLILIRNVDNSLHENYLIYYLSDIICLMRVPSISSNWRSGIIQWWNESVYRWYVSRIALGVAVFQLDNAELFYAMDQSVFHLLWHVNFVYFIQSVQSISLWIG